MPSVELYNNMDIKELQKEIVQTDNKTVSGRLFLLERDHGKQRIRPEYMTGDRVTALLTRLRDLQVVRRDAKADILDGTRRGHRGRW